MFERFTRAARASVVFAQEEARDLGSRDIRPEHLLVGVLQSSDTELIAVCEGFGLTADAVRTRLSCVQDGGFEDDAEALRAIGIDLHAIRDSVTTTFGPDAFDGALHSSGRRRRRRGHLPFSRSAKKALEYAVREASAHHDRGISSEHLLLGILRLGDRFTLGLITEHVYVTQLRTAVLALLKDAA